MRLLSTTWRTTTTALLVTKQHQRHLLLHHHSFPFFSSSSSFITTTTNTNTILSKQQNPSKYSVSPPFSSSSAVLFSSSSSSSSTSSSTSESNSFATSYHAPVMWKECIDALLECQRSKQRRKQQPTTSEDATISTPLIFVDGTLGGGGHTAALLERLQPGDIVLGCDVDPAALEVACQRLERYLGGTNNDNQQPDASSSSTSLSLPLLIPVQCNFCDLAKKLPTIRHPITQELVLAPHDGMVDGILLDLGVSSYQIDTAERGFAFMKDGPLDMRMSASASSTTSSTSFTAADICNEFAVEDLAHFFKLYGDEPRAKAIARSITQHRPLTTTGQLREAVAAVIPEFNRKSRRQGLMATLARVFQSLRIVVNKEDEALAKALTDMCPTLIRPGGRLVVMSYHSMEDRAVKRIMKHGTVESQADYRERDLYGNVIHTGPPIPWRPVGKWVKATEEEVEANPRARSATLRIAERL